MIRITGHGPRRLAIMLLAALMGAVGTSLAHAEEQPDFLAFSVGAFDVLDDQTAADFRVEYRSDLRFWWLYPFAGVSATSDKAVYGYGGFGLEVLIGRSFVFTPNAAVGLFDEGDGKDLGGPVEFRTGAELAWRFDGKGRLGIAFHHISNASIYDSNPGTEMLVLTYAVPLSGAP